MSDSVVSLDNTGLAFGLVIAAGLSTALGAAAVFNQRIVKLTSKPVLAAGLGFSSGVMIYVSFVEIFGKSKDAFVVDGKEEKNAYFCATLCLFSGMVVLQLLSFLVHKIDKNHHCNFDEDGVEEVQKVVSNQTNAGAAEQGQAPDLVAAAAVAAAEQDNVKGTCGTAAKAQPDAKQLQVMGLNTAAAIAIHNFPEGLATFVATLAEPSVGVTLAIAIGIHNIPEGLCVALPIYYATGSRLKAFLWALLSGISEPIGAFIGWLIIKSTGDDMNQLVYGVLFGLVAGMMIMIVILELLPTAYKYDPKGTRVTNSVVFGMAVMAASLCMFMA